MRYFLLFLFLLSIPCFAHDYQIPDETDNIITIIERWQYSRWSIVGANSRELAITNPNWRGEFETFKDATDRIKEKYIIIKIIKDSIDDEYFVCVKKRK